MTTRLSGLYVSSDQGVKKQNIFFVSDGHEVDTKKIFTEKSAWLCAFFRV